MGSAVIQRALTEPCCTKCGAPELKTPDELNVRCLTVWDADGGWSHCLACDTWFLESPHHQEIS